MHHSGAIIVLIMSTLIAAGCGTPERDFSKLTGEFVYSTLTFSPIAATAAGLHQYQGQNLDEQLDDISPADLGHQREYYQRFSERLQNEVKPDTLSAESRADFHIMLDQIALRLLDLDETQSQQSSVPIVDGASAAEVTIVLGHFQHALARHVAPAQNILQKWHHFFGPVGTAERNQQDRVARARHGRTSFKYLSNHAMERSRESTWFSRLAKPWPSPG